MRTSAGTATVAPAARATGRLIVPGDKSISHRYAMLAALADGTSRIRGFSLGSDCLATLGCVAALGIQVERTGTDVVITGRGVDGLRAAAAPLDAQNSGTTLRLMTGLLAAQPFRTAFVGDASLSRRPMQRIVTPLSQMGARIRATDGRAPLTIDGAPLHGITWRSPVPSAQVKSCVLLAGLYASGATAVEESRPTRDHTERALETFGVPVTRTGSKATVSRASRLRPQDLLVPGDISGAAFWCALAAGTPGGDITIEHVGLNPTRTAYLDLLTRAGADVSVETGPATPGEPVGSLRVQHRTAADMVITPDDVPGVIDEIPALAALAAMGPEGRTLTVRGASELRVKESDRITVLAEGFKAMGCDVEEFEDGFRLTARPLRGGVTVDAAGDHRLAMAYLIAATRASDPVTVENVAVEVSYPGFLDALAEVTGAPR